MSDLCTPAFKPDECVIYKNNGICRISEITERKFAGETRDYYVLISIFDPHSTWYVPLDSPELTSSMSRTLSKKQIDGVIAACADIGEIWDDDFKTRSELFADVLKSGDRARLLAMYLTLSRRKTEAEKHRRKLYVSDERVLRAAEKLITEEFSFVLGIRRDEAAGYVAERLKK